MEYMLLLMAGLIAGHLFFALRRYTWPAGPRMVYYSWSSKVVITGPIRSPTFVHAGYAAAEAAELAGIAWSKAYPKSKARLPPLYGIHFMEDETFEELNIAHKRYVRHRDSAVIHARNSFGCRAPLVLIKKSAVHSVIRTGQPLIHQMLHYLLEESGDADGDAAHVSIALWHDPAKKGLNSLEDAILLLYTEDSCRLNQDTSCSELLTKGS